MLGRRKAYLTFDIDCLDPALRLAPAHLWRPVCRGAHHRSGLGQLELGMDIVEVAPAYDHAEITAIAAATLGHDMLCLLAQKNALRRGRPTSLA